MTDIHESKAIFRCVCGEVCTAGYDPKTGAAEIFHPQPTCDLWEKHNDPTDFLRAVREAKQAKA